MEADRHCDLGTFPFGMEIMNSLKQRIEKARSKWLFINTGMIHRLEKDENITELAHMAKILPKHAYNEGVSFGFAEAIRMLRTEDTERSGKIFGLEFIETRPAFRWADWLQSQIDGKERK